MIVISVFLWSNCIYKMQLSVWNFMHSHCNLWFSLCATSSECKVEVPHPCPLPSIAFSIFQQLKATLCAGACWLGSFVCLPCHRYHHWAFIISVLRFGAASSCAWLFNFLCTYYVACIAALVSLMCTAFRPLAIAYYRFLGDRVTNNELVSFDILNCIVWPWLSVHCHFHLHIQLHQELQLPSNSQTPNQPILAVGCRLSLVSQSIRHLLLGA